MNLRREAKVGGFLHTLWNRTSGRSAILLQLWRNHHSSVRSSPSASTPIDWAADCRSLHRLVTGLWLGPEPDSRTVCAWSDLFRRRSCGGLSGLLGGHSGRVCGHTRSDARQRARALSRSVSPASAHRMKAEYPSGAARLSYWSQGTGAPVVFLHPTPLDHDYWRPFAQQLSGIRAIIPDLRGHGTSELGSNLPVGGFSLVPDAPVLSMAQYAADIVALLDHLELARALFAGL